MRMKRSLWMALVANFFLGNAFAEDLPRFEDFPVREFYQGKNAPIRLTSPQAREFRTRLREAAEQKPNFAGHYILATWGCGSGCRMPAIIDAKSGKATMIPFTVTTMGEEVIAPLQFNVKSNLLIVNGSRDEGMENGTFYYKWENNRLELIRSISK